MKETHRIYLSTGAQNEDQWSEAFDMFSKLAASLMNSGYMNVTVNSHVVDEEPLDHLEEVRYDENTLFKVMDCLTEHDCTVDKAREIITAMQNAGILFRERL